MRGVIALITLLVLVSGLTILSFDTVEKFDRENIGDVEEKIPEPEEKENKLDIAKYDQLSEYVANNPAPRMEIITSTSTNSYGVVITSTSTKIIKEDYLYPVMNIPYPKEGAILPFNRIISYYGNFYSTRMGILGEFEESEVLRRLQIEVDKWNIADPEISALPAIHYIASTAQSSPGDEGLYTLRMPDEHIDRAVSMAEKIDGIVFLDLQIGLSTIERELPYIEKYLKMPQVHLGIDPEFSMKDGTPPGKKIGSYSDKDINYVIDYLSKIVRENDLPPKVLVIHRFTNNMITDYQNIKPTEEVQVVIHMDGWGSPSLKFNTYNVVVAPEPVQFTGFKIFYGNDLKQSPHRLVTPQELLELQPRPLYLQYQ